MAGRFFFGRSYAGDGDRSIEAAVSVRTSGTPSTISHPICLILSSRVSSTSVLIVQHICFRHHPLPNQSSHINFYFCLRHHHRQIMPSPWFERACKSLCVAPQPPNKADTTTTVYPAAADLLPRFRGRIHHRDSHSRLRRRIFNCITINPRAKAEQNIFHLLLLLPVPDIPTLLTCLPLPDLSISLL